MIGMLVHAAFGLLTVTPMQYTVSHAYFGIDGRDVPKRGGVEVVETDPGSPAIEALRAGDTLLSWNGLPTRTVKSLFDLVERHAPADRVTLEVRRGGEDIEVVIELGDAARICDEGVGVACSLLAWRHQNASFEYGYPAAAKLYERACDHGFVHGCVSLANMYYFGNGVEKDRARSTSMFAELCKAEVSSACLSLGEAYISGDGIDLDEARGIELLEWSCEHGEPYACSTLGYYFENGRHVPADWARAADFYQEACEGGWTNSCDDWWYLERHDPEDEREAPTFPRATPELDEALFQAVDSRDLKEVVRLLAAGANPNVRGDSGDLHGVRAIVGAFFTGELEVVHALLDAGAPAIRCRLG